MKIAYSSLAAPAWDFPTLVARAAEYGFDGLELRGLQGELHLPLCPELTRSPEHIRKLLVEHKVELVCLGSSASLTAKKVKELAKEKMAIIEFIELAARLGCPHVRVFAGETQGLDTREACLARVAAMLMSLAPVAARYEVTLLIENGGDFAGSADLWYLIDAVGHPNVRCCWNQCNAMTLRERPTNSLPRLGGKIGMVHVCDASFHEGALQDYKPIGEGHCEVGKQMELLKGLVFQRYVTFEWPKLWVESLPGPESILPQAAKFLRSKIDEKQAVLSAYKGDKNAPKLASLPAAS